MVRFVVAASDVNRAEVTPTPDGQVHPSGSSPSTGNRLFNVQRGSQRGARDPLGNRFCAAAALRHGAAYCYRTNYNKISAFIPTHALFSQKSHDADGPNKVDVVCGGPHGRGRHGHGPSGVGTPSSASESHQCFFSPQYQQFCDRMLLPQQQRQDVNFSLPFQSKVPL